MIFDPYRSLNAFAVWYGSFWIRQRLLLKPILFNKSIWIHSTDDAVWLITILLNNILIIIIIIMICKAGNWMLFPLFYSEQYMQLVSGTASLHLYSVLPSINKWLIVLQSHIVRPPSFSQYWCRVFIGNFACLLACVGWNMTNDALPARSTVLDIVFSLSRRSERNGM